MVVMFQPWLLLLLHLFLSVIIPFSSGNPQNIETSYPFDFPPFPPPAPPTINDPPISTPSPPPPPLISSPPPQSASPSEDNKTIAKAVGVTAASTILVAVVFFFTLQRFVIAKRQRVGDHNSDGGRPVAAVLPANEFTKFDGNIRGLIVDENGLDVLYWRKLEEGDNRKNFDKQILQNPMHEEKVVIQEVPLLRGKSSCSHTKILPEDVDLDHVIASKPNPAARVFRTIEEKELPIEQPNVPPPPRPQPIQSKKSSAPPPPPPPVPPKKSPAPPPPPPKGSGLGAPLKPPSGPKRSSIEGQVEESSAVAGNENGNGKVKLKPLHWDKVNKTMEHSMVWDKIEGGSFR